MLYYERNQEEVLQKSSLKRLTNRQNYFIHIYQEVLTMYIYDELNELDESVENYGVSPLSYVVLECGR